MMSINAGCFVVIFPDSLVSNSAGILIDRLDISPSDQVLYAGTTLVDLNILFFAF
jgi:hypothetical protein